MIPNKENQRKNNSSVELRRLPVFIQYSVTQSYCLVLLARVRSNLAAGALNAAIKDYLNKDDKI